MGFFFGGGAQGRGGAHFASRVCVCISECAPPPPVCVCEDNIDHKANIAKDALIDSAARPNGAGELSLPEYKQSAEQRNASHKTRQDSQTDLRRRPGCERLRSHRRSVRRENHEAGSTIAIKRQSPSFHSHSSGAV